MARPIPWQAGWWLLLLGLLASGVVRGVSMLLDADALH
jgi:hypothetical protein